MTPLTWNDLQEPLKAAWIEMDNRGGSFADGPCEAGPDFEAILGPVQTLEAAAHRALEAWIDTDKLPVIAPAANRYAATQLVCALGLVRNLAALSIPSLPPEWSRQEALQWLLFYVHADTVQVAL